MHAHRYFFPQQQQTTLDPVPVTVTMIITALHRPVQGLAKKTLGSQARTDTVVHRVSAHTSNVSRALFSSSSEPFLPRITERRLNEQGAGGRSTNAGVKVAIFGATGFLGKHVCNQLGELLPRCVCFL